MKRLCARDAAGLGASERSREVFLGGAQLEFEALRAMARVGILAPRPLLYARWQGQALLAMAVIPHSETLRQRFFGLLPAAGAPVKVDPREVVRCWALPLARTVARLHGAGWYHRDLYLQHCVLVASPGRAAGGPDAARIAVLDFGRARQGTRVRRRWFEKDLAALAASAPESLRETLLESLIPAYLEARGLPRSGAQSWGRWVRWRARRMNARAPRHTDANTREGHLTEGEVDPRFLR